MDAIEELKRKDLLRYIENLTSQKAVKAGVNTYKFKKCPICGKGDHLTVNTAKNYYNGFGNSCGGGSIIDFHLNYYNKDKKAAIDELCKEFGIKLNIKPGNYLISNNKKNEEKVKPNSKEPSTNTYKEIDLTSIVNNYYMSDNNDLAYFIGRGIFEDDVSNRYKFFSGNIREVFRNSLDIIPKVNNIDSYEFVIPIWESGKVVNCIFRRNDIKSTDGPKTLNLKGLEVKLFNSDYLMQSEKLIFVTEGIFDCLSIECLGYKSICLNSVNMASRFIDLVKAHFDNVKDTKFILSLDNDAAGAKATKKIAEALKELNIKSYNLSFSSKYKDVNEYYIEDPEGLRADIENIFSPPSVFKYMNTFRKNIIRNKHTPVINTGFDGLNSKLNGGLYPGLYTIGAISSLGKTALTLQIADNIAKTEQHVLFFSLEMPTDELISRSISRLMFLTDPDRCKDVGTARVLNGYIDSCKNEFECAIDKYTNNISKHITIVQGDFDMNVDSIVSYVKNFIESTNIKPVVFIDYLQIVKPSKEFRFCSDKQSIDDIVVKFKMLSRDFYIPVFVVSSFNRENYNSPVSFFCFKESGGIEYTSDFVLGLQLSVLDDSDKRGNEIALQNAKKGDKNGTREVTLVILKNRNGQSNTKQKFKFYAKNNLFAELEDIFES